MAAYIIFSAVRLQKNEFSGCILTQNTSDLAALAGQPLQQQQPATAAVTKLQSLIMEALQAIIVF